MPKYTTGARSDRRIGRMPSQDASNNFVYDVSQGKSAGEISERLAALGRAVSRNTIKIDDETANLINWLVKEQNVSPEIALKKSVAISAYIQDITANQGCMLLVQREHLTNAMSISTYWCHMRE